MTPSRPIRSGEEEQNSAVQEAICPRRGAILLAEYRRGLTGVSLEAIQVLPRRKPCSASGGANLSPFSAAQRLRGRSPHARRGQARFTASAFWQTTRPYRQRQRVAPLRKGCARTASSRAIISR